MIKLVKGSKIVDFSSEELIMLAQKYEQVVLDLGTGDGRFVYKKALKEPKALFIGLDPSAKQLAIYAKKAVKSKVDNTLFIVNSLENIKDEFNGLADKIYVFLPWGTLLQHLIKPTKEYVEKLATILKSEGNIEIILGYTEDSEPTQVERLQLANLSMEYLQANVVTVFKDTGLNLKELVELNKTELATLETTWGKKLAFGQNRPLFKLLFQKN